MIGISPTMGTAPEAIPSSTEFGVPSLIEGETTAMALLYRLASSLAWTFSVRNYSVWIA